MGTTAYAQNRSISGTVLDSSKLPVVGASVIVAGSASIGTVTDVDGTFSLNVPAGSSITVSCIGYTTQTIAVGTQSVFDIVLLEDDVEHALRSTSSSRRTLNSSRKRSSSVTAPRKRSS